jgi:GT2 family glycosyltransferase/Tfp pilus assembly protein PilF/glycosyltransferase involved in cell wall biosynthesis
LPSSSSPLVSIIVPTYNRPDLLVQALESIIGQTFQNFEIIVINDGGIDPRPLTINLTTENNIQYLSHNENKGVSAARNSGLRIAKGKYIAYLDDDDLFYPEHVTTLVTFLEESYYKVAYTDSYRAFQSQASGRYEVVRRELAYGIDFDNDRILVDNFVPVLCFMHEKGCIEESGYFDESLRRHEDWDLWIRMSRKFRIAHIPKVTCEFSCRVDGSSMIAGTVPMFLATKTAIYEKYRGLASPDVQRRQRADMWEFMRHLYAFLELRTEPLVPLFTAGRYAEGEAKLAELATTGATQTQLQSALAGQLALAYLQSSAVAEAVTQFEQAVAVDVMNPIACHNLAAVYRKTGRSADAARVYRQIIERNESEVSALIALAELATERGDVTEARSCYEQVLTVEPDHCASTGALAALPLPGPSARREDRLKIAVYSLEHPDHACARIRVIAPTETLVDSVELKWGVNLESEKAVVDPALIAWADLIIVQRFFPMANTAPLLESILAAGKPVIYETDDLLLEVPATNPHQKYAEAVRPFIYDLIAKVSAITISTEEMKRAFTSYHHHVHVLPNLLDERLWGIAEKKGGDPVVIGYTGTPTHQADLAMIEESLERIAQAYGNRVSFVFMGCVTDRLATLPGARIIDFTKDYSSYASTVQKLGIDIALIPLADNRFNRCKSNIKWLEYSACGISGIYSDLPPYSCIRDLETGLLVRNTPADWFNALDYLISNPVRRKWIAENARRDVMAHYTVASQAHLYLDTYTRIVAEHSQKTGKIKFSIIIMTWNRAAMLDQCLTTLFASLTDRDNCQIIVGNNGSTDNTEEVISSYRIDRYVKKTEKTGQEFYQELFDLAEGEYIIELDDDVVDLPKNFNQLFGEYFRSFPDYGFLGLDVVQNRFTNGAKPEPSQYVEDVRSGMTVQEGGVIGCCACIKKETFDRIGGFNDVILSTANVEDGVITERVRNLGLRTGIIKDVKCFHANGPYYSKAYGYIERDIEKYAMAGLDSFVATYRSVKEEKKVASNVSIIIPLFNKVEYTRQCLEGVMRSTTSLIDFEIILVDNASSDGTPDYLRTLAGDVTIITNLKNLGFARACNQGARLATGDYVVFLNNDTIPKPGWLEALIDGIEHDGADICGSRLLYPDGRVQHAGVAFSERGIGYHIFNGFAANDPAVTRKRFMQSVTAACMIMRRELFQKMNGFDEGYMNGFEDVDLCLRAGELGNRILYVPDSTLIHFEETSEGRKAHDEANARRFLARWGGRVRCDDNDFYRREGYDREVLPDGKIRVFKAEGTQPPSSSARGNDSSVERRLERVDSLVKEGKLSEALAGYQAILGIDTNNHRAMTGIGVIRLLEGKRDEAGISFERALRIAPDDPKALCGVGLVEGMKGRYEPAFECFSRSLEKDPENLTALGELVKCAYRLERFTEAERHFENYLRYHPADLDMLFSQAGIQFRVGKYAEALDNIEKLLIFAPEYEGGQEMKERIKTMPGLNQAPAYQYRIAG